LVVIRLLGKGEIAGFRAVLVNEPYAATAEVVEPADVCTIPAATFQSLLDNSSGFKSAIIKKLAIELRISEERMLDQAVLPARIRIARILLYLAEQSSSKSVPQTIQTSLLRQDLAEAVGVTPQTFSRILHQLNGEGIVRSSRSQIVVTSPSRLRAMASREH
jgi:CRP/FNR family transcriptional regulator